MVAEETTRTKIITRQNVTLLRQNVNVNARPSTPESFHIFIRNNTFSIEIQDANQNENIPTGVDVSRSCVAGTKRSGGMISTGLVD